MNKQDFESFTQGETPSPTHLDERVLTFVHNELNPPHQKVFLKLVLVQGFIGALTLLFCPQFNLSLTNYYDLFHFFHMTFGHKICMIICGGIFLGSGAFFSTYILSNEEVNQIKKSRFLYYTGLSILAVSTFMVFGAEVYLNAVIFWLIGSIGIGIAVFEANRSIREVLLAP